MLDDFGAASRIFSPSLTARLKCNDVLERATTPSSGGLMFDTSTKCHWYAFADEIAASLLRSFFDCHARNLDHRPLRPL
ncbi:MAG TPA: hypothetical protein PK867_25175, partial [Pirellulales bacterium]|nr:hypothetical protein [Pirellulales bacterium]